MATWLRIVLFSSSRCLRMFSTHLALQLTFRKAGEDTPLWEKRYDERTSMNKRDAHSAAEALSKLYGKFMQDALENIVRAK